jgi:hypothetical protein
LITLRFILSQNIMVPLAEKELDGDISPILQSRQLAHVVSRTVSENDRHLL